MQVKAPVLYLGLHHMYLCSILTLKHLQASVDGNNEDEKAENPWI